MPEVYSDKPISFGGARATDYSVVNALYRTQQILNQRPMRLLIPHENAERQFRNPPHARKIRSPPTLLSVMANLPWP